MDPPKNFPFPFAPYPIQKNFMRNLYNCLEQGKLGIFESPTGTGKSLSIICGALKWLLDKEAWEKETLVTQIPELNFKIKEISEKNAGDWFTKQTEQMQLNNEKRALEIKLEAIEKRIEKKDKLKEKSQQADDFRKKHKFKSKPAKCVDNKKSTEIQDGGTEPVKESIDDDLLLEDLNIDSDVSDEETGEPAKYTQIFFCSRTHSQLSQLVGELKKSPYSDKVSLVPLASR